MAAENPIPALVRGPYFSRGNAPMGANNDTQTKMRAWRLWFKFSCLLNANSLGETKGTQPSTPRATYTLVRCSDGVSVSTSDLLGAATFNASKWVAAANGVAHSWALLVDGEGNHLVLDLVTATAGAEGIRRIRSPATVSTGTIQSAPMAVGGQEEFCAGTQSVAAGSSYTYCADNTTGQNNYEHFVINSNGDFVFFETRSGLGLVSGFLAFWEGSGGRANDPRNFWLLTSAVATGRGSPAHAGLVGSSGAVRRSRGDGVPMSQSGIRPWLYGGTTMAGTGVDSNTVDGDYLTAAVDVGNAQNGNPLKCGHLPDLLFVSGGVPGAPVPADPPDMERMVGGDLMWPFGVKVVI